MLEKTKEINKNEDRSLSYCSPCNATSSNARLPLGKVLPNKTVSNTHSLYRNKFCLPERSVHSSRIITPNKRFFDADDFIVERKKPRLQQKVMLADIVVEQESSLSLDLRNSIEDEIEVNNSCAPSTVDLDVTPTNTMCPSYDIGEQSAVKNVNACAIGKAPSEVFSSVANIELSSVNHSLSGILQKPRLQLDWAAVDRSKAALALSLRQQMDKESLIMSQLSAVDDYSHIPLALKCQNSILFSSRDICQKAVGANSDVSFSYPSKNQGISIFQSFQFLYY